MIDHLGLSVSDFEAARKFYDAALAPLDISFLVEISKEYTDGVAVGGYGTDRPRFWLSGQEAQKPRAHVAFSAKDHATVDAFHAAALQVGGTDNGAPGLRAQYHPDYYGAFVLDPDGNNIEAVCHAPQG